MDERTAARFWAKVDKDGPLSAHRPELGPCWLWTAARMANGYGRFKLRSYHAVLVHRLAYESTVGAIPAGLTIDHLCRNRGCVNPAHLEAVTNGANVLRGEGFAAVNAAKTHCIHGHEFTPENTYTDPNGWRECRLCMRARDVARRPR